MAEYETKVKQEKEEAKRRKKAQPVYDQLKQVAVPEDSQRDQAGAVLGLQQTYGNKYVQGLAEGSEETTPDEDIIHRIESQRGSGKPLESGVRSQMEAAFRSDFSQVRIHSDAEADRLSRELSAKAFTTRKDIFFSEGTYEPNSENGSELLAHELAHVTQEIGPISAPLHKVTQPFEFVEVEANLVGNLAPKQTVSTSKKLETDTIACQEALEVMETDIFVPFPLVPIRPVMSYSLLVPGIAAATEADTRQCQLAWDAAKSRIPEIKGILRHNPGCGVLLSYAWKMPDPREATPQAVGILSWTFLFVGLVRGTSMEEAIAEVEGQGYVGQKEGWKYANTYHWIPPFPTLPRR